MWQSRLACAAGSQCLRYSERCRSSASSSLGIGVQTWDMCIAATRSEPNNSGRFPFLVQQGTFSWLIVLTANRH